MEAIIIRKMLPEEAKEVKKLGLRTFHSMEGLFISLPKEALVAVHNDKLVAGIMLKIITNGEQKLGYIDFAFVDPSYHGYGIGNRLYLAAFEELKSRGCQDISALVKGDNVGSFHLFEKNGFVRCKLSDAWKRLGTKGFLGLVFKTELKNAPGMDLYMNTVPEKKGSISQIFYYLLINMLLLVFGYFTHKSNYLSYISAAFTLMLYGIITSGILLPLFKRRFHFRLSNCGFLITSIVTLVGGFFPLMGRWYPDKFDKSKDLKRELCMITLAEWYGYILLGGIITFAPLSGEYWAQLSFLIKAFLIFRMIPTFPFSEYAATRVVAYHKIAYAFSWIVSLLFLIFM